MAEYIGLKSVLTVVDDWVKCGDIGDKKPTIKASIRAIPIADVIEREKIDAAIEEIENNRRIYEVSMDYTDGAKEQAYSEVLDILKKHIGE